MLLLYLKLFVYFCGLRDFFLHIYNFFYRCGFGEGRTWCSFGDGRAWRTQISCIIYCRLTKCRIFVRLTLMLLMSNDFTALCSIILQIKRFKLPVKLQFQPLRCLKVLIQRFLRRDLGLAGLVGLLPIMVLRDRRSRPALLPEQSRYYGLALVLPRLLLSVHVRTRLRVREQQAILLLLHRLLVELWRLLLQLLPFPWHL